MTHLKLRIGKCRSAYRYSACRWPGDILNQIAQLLTKITQNTSINAISVNGICFSQKEIDFFKFWFTQPFGDATINKDKDNILLVRYLNN